MWKTGDIFIVRKTKTWIGMFLSAVPAYGDKAVLNYIYRTGDTKFTQRPIPGLAYAEEDLPGLTQIKKLKKYQRSLLKNALKLSLENKDIDNLEYIEALSTIKEIK